ncbi:hypothetical protein Desaci_1288 [Desulfosporosinus acidiphilus SJ4]|uniref:Uncharacterized protein n=1 Tax=Desulfosporosinus acidiphilus (strain DSM 22704 / JCM 16185 / SJ4) TaxID=646529 RepID=I4D3E0_DESAJ|nr:hypothetical protein [Desulfosporosinus acidiphilus]AFM40314.1 hypothetical protein Desaci_1288 [Desulfosporosinus acidiphilus SJ4]
MQKFTPRQSSFMAKTLRDLIHAYGLSKEQLAGLAKAFGVQETSVKGMEVELIRAMNDGEDLDWSKKRR